MKAVADNALPDLRKQIVSATIHDAGGKNPVGFFIYNGCEYRIKVVMINGKKAEKVFDKPPVGVNGMSDKLLIRQGLLTAVCSGFLVIKPLKHSLQAVLYLAPGQSVCINKGE